MSKKGGVLTKQVEDESKVHVFVLEFPGPFHSVRSQTQDTTHSSINNSSRRCPETTPETVSDKTCETNSRHGTFYLYYKMTTDIM